MKKILFTSMIFTLLLIMCMPMVFADQGDLGLEIYMNDHAIKWHNVTGATGYSIRLYNEKDELLNKESVPASQSYYIHYDKLKALDVPSGKIGIVVLAEGVSNKSDTINYQYVNPNLHIKISEDGVATWDKVPNVQSYRVDISFKGYAVGGTKNLKSEEYNLKEFLDSNNKTTGSYELRVTCYINDKAETFSYAEYSYISSYGQLDVPTNLRWDGLIAKWDSVKNATNYEVRLYSKTGPLKVTRDSSKPEFDYTNLDGGKVTDGCYFTVIAKADNYRDSNESSESPKYKAPTRITEVKFKEYTYPRAGQDYSTKEIKLSDDENCTIVSAYFVMEAYGKKIGLSNSDEAQKGEEVQLYITVQANDGYQFDGTAAYLNGVLHSTYKENSDTNWTFIWNYTVPEFTGITITEQSPAIVEYKVGDDVKLFVKANGANSYQWNQYERGAGIKAVSGFKAIAGATNSEYVIKNADKSLNGAPFNCTIISSNGNETSNTFTLKLVEGGTTSTEQPTEQPTTQEYDIMVSSMGAGNLYLKTDKGTAETDSKTVIKTLKATNGTKVEIKATANSGYKFDKWEITSFSTGETKEITTANYTFNASEKVIASAYFSEIETTTEQPTQTEQPVKTEEPAKTEEPTQTEQPKEKTWTKASEWAEEELDKANKMEIIPNKLKYADLTANITRAEFAHVAVKLYEKLTGNKAIAVPNNPFIDTADEEVLKAYNLEITKGTSEVTFNPDDLITREQMATMMTRALTKAGIDTKVDLEKVNKFADDGEMHDWGKESIYYMSSIEIIKGVGNNTFNVLGNATREQALLISERSAEKFAK